MGPALSRGGPFCVAGCYGPRALIRFTDRRLRAALVLSVGAALVHLVPLFLPREDPGVDLGLVHLVTEPTARRKFLEPLIDNPRSQPSHLLEAAVHLLPHEPELARRFIAEAERRGGAPGERQLVEARICHAEGNGTCVTEALDHARALLPEDPRPELVEADLAERDGAEERKRTALSRAHARSPADSAIALRYAQALGGSGDIEGALRILEGAERTMTPVAALRERALIKLGGGDAVGAAADLEAAVEAAPKDGTVRYLLGLARFRMNDFPRAEVSLREASRMEGADWRPLALLCALQREDRRLDDAVSTRTMLDARFRMHRAQYDEACPP